MRFTKEAGEICGDSIHHLSNFRLARGAFKMGAISCKVVEAKRPDPPGKPAVDEIAFAFAKNDASKLLYQLDDGGKIAVVKAEFPLYADLHS